MRGGKNWWGEIVSNTIEGLMNNNNNTIIDDGNYEILNIKLL